MRCAPALRKRKGQRRRVVETEQMPWQIKPMLAFSSEPFDSQDYIFEDKYDGTRALLFVNRGARFQNRRVLDITHRYPELAGVAGAVRASEAVIDGEIVVFSGGRPDPSALQKREFAQDPEIEALSKKMPATFVAFDLLSVEGKNIMSSPLTFRRELLGKMIKENKKIFHLPFVAGEGLKHFQSAVEKGLEGIMAKQKGSRYLPGERSRSWLKVKSVETVDCTICGRIPGNVFLLGACLDGKLTYVGRLQMGEAELKGFEFPESGICPFKDKPLINEEVAWLEPRLVCEVGYKDTTLDHKLRSPVFVRFRNDKNPGECAA